MSYAAVLLGGSSSLQSDITVSSPSKLSSIRNQVYERTSFNLNTPQDPKTNDSSSISTLKVIIDRQKVQIEHLERQVQELTRLMKSSMTNSPSPPLTSYPAGNDVTTQLPCAEQPQPTRKSRDVPPRKSNYANAIASVTASQTRMDCSYSSNSLESDPKLVDARTNSVYAKAAQILAVSSELEGEDRETVLTLLMDFHRSLDYCTDDDAMSSLYD
jgi:hypothetical protein